MEIEQCGLQLEAFSYLVLAEVRCFVQSLLGGDRVAGDQPREKEAMRKL